MGKNSKYKTPEREQQHNRVDIYRTTQFEPQNMNQQHEAARQNNVSYINTAFVSSNFDLNTTTSTPASSVLHNTQSTIYTIPVHHTTTRLQAKQQQKRNSSSTASGQRKYKICLATSITFVVLLILAAVGLALGFTLFKSKEYIDKRSYMCPICEENSFCVKYPDRQPECVCRPGYTPNTNTGQCQQVLCYGNYVPVTNGLAENSTYGMPISEVFGLKPVCCPQGTPVNSAGCCGISNNDIFTKMKRIIGGLDSSTGNWPWVVDIIQVYRPNPSRPIEIISNCTGVLLTDRHVLTAAHCLTFDGSLLNGEFPDLKSLLRVHFGFTSKSEIYGTPRLQDFQRFVSRISIHENFNSDVLLNDIAVLELNTPIPRSPTVDYLCLFNYGTDDSLVYRDRLYAVGWGTVSKNLNQPQYANTLQYVDLQVQDMSECYYIAPDPNYRHIFNQTKQICAGYKESDRVSKDTCFADSGGPLMVRLNGQWFSYGIVSFGSQTSCGDGPAVYTRTAFYYNWIMSKIR